MAQALRSFSFHDDANARAYGDVARVSWAEVPAEGTLQVRGNDFDGNASSDVSAAVQGPASTTGTWWIVAPYVWIPGLHGQLTTFGQTRGVDIDTSDVLSALDNANGALQIHLESGRGPLGLILDANIIRLSQDAQLPAGTLDFDIQQTLIEVLGMYRWIEVPSDCSPLQTYAVDFLAGARYYNFFNGVTLFPADPTLPDVPLGQSGTWVDLVVGMRGRAPILPGLDAFARGDFGGFGMGTSSKLAWNLVAGVNWHATEHCSFLAGYRILAIDESQGSGVARFGFDARMEGPFLALSLQY